MTKLLSIRAGLTALSLITVLGFAAPFAHAAMMSQMDFGSQGADVTSLQTYLSTNPSLYPSGLVTGYFGPLTQAGVERFQTAQSIVSSGSPSTTGYGRVGPQTLARLNTLMGSVAQDSGMPVPVLSNSFAQYTNTTATITWSSDEQTTGQVNWDTQPIIANEESASGQTPYTSGTLTLDSGGFQTSHSVSLANLQPNTTYYYMIRARNTSGG